jgi:uncharacterized protein (DUF433 family)
MNWQARIEINPKVLCGKPVVKGTRLAVEFLLGLIAGGMAEGEILDAYPGLAREDLQACIAYAAFLLSTEHIYPVPA